MWLLFIDDKDNPLKTGSIFYNADLFPMILGAFTIPENDLTQCAETEARLPGTRFNSHKLLVFENLVFIAWVAGGLRAVDISNPGTPHETGFFFNKPVKETERGSSSRLGRGIVDPELRLESHPVMKDGLIYVIDVNSGLYVLKYTGERKKELPKEGLFTSNALQVPLI